MPLSEKQEDSLIEALDGSEAILIWEGAVRSGKTMSSILAWCEYCRTHAPPGPLLMVGKTKDTLQRNVLDEIHAYFGDASPLKHTAGANTGTLFGRKVHMVGANDAKAESRIRGLTLAGAYVDEATLLPNESFWSMLLTRHATTFSRGAKIFATTNPDSPAHWFKRNVIDKATTIRAKVWKFVLDDNPVLDEDAKAQLKRSLFGLFYKRFILGLWVAAEGAIYDMLDLGDGVGAKGRHRVTWAQVPTLTRFWLGIDYGDLNPFHAVLLALGTDQKLYVVGEWRYSGREAQRQKEQTEYEADVRHWLEGMDAVYAEHDVRVIGESWPERIAVDPSAAGFRNVLRNRQWSGLTTPDDKINPVRDGIRNVASLLGNDRMRFVEGAAPQLEAEMLGYVWDEKRADVGEDAPVKVDDHGPDALRYAVASCRSTWRPWLGLPA